MQKLPCVTCVISVSTPSHCYIYRTSIKISNIYIVYQLGYLKIVFKLFISFIHILEIVVLVFSHKNGKPILVFVHRNYISYYN